MVYQQASPRHLYCVADMFLPCNCPALFDKNTCVLYFVQKTGILQYIRLMLAILLSSENGRVPVIGIGKIGLMRWHPQLNLYFF